MGRVIITGASSGIGLELAKVFAKNQHDLILVARSKEKLMEIAEILSEKYKVQTTVFSKDLTDLESIKEVYNELKSQNIDIDFLINNAGFGDFGLFYETNWQNEKKMIDLNITALTYFTKLFLKDMVSKNSGKIMNLASTASFQPGPLMAVYYATKAYVLHFSEAVANEIKNTDVTITALCPGPTSSGFQETANLEGSGLIKGKLPTSAEVAEYGYKVMMKGKTVSIHGLMNKIMAASVRFLPRNIVTNIVRNLSEKK